MDGEYGLYVSGLECCVLVIAKQRCQSWQTSGDDRGMRFDEKPYYAKNNRMKERID